MTEPRTRYVLFEEDGRRLVVDVGDYDSVRLLVLEWDPERSVEPHDWFVKRFLTGKQELLPEGFHELRELLGKASAKAGH